MNAHKVVSGNGSANSGAKQSYLVLSMILILACSVISATAQEINLTPRGAPSLKSMQRTYGVPRMAPAPPVRPVPPGTPTALGRPEEEAEKPRKPCVTICPSPPEAPTPSIEQAIEFGFSNSFKEPRDSTLGSAGYTIVWRKNRSWQDKGHKVTGSLVFKSLDFWRFLREAARGTLDDAISIKGGGSGKALISPGLWLGSGLYLGGTRSEGEWSGRMTLVGKATMDISSLEDLSFGIAYSGDIFDISNVISLVEDGAKTLGVTATYSTTHYACAREFTLDFTLGGTGTEHHEKKWSYNGDVTLRTNLGTGNITVGYTCTHQQDIGVFHTIRVAYDFGLPNIF